jgi:hypothetical protein
MDVCDLDTSLLKLGKPNKVDRSCFAKVRYNGSSRFSVNFCNVRVLNHRTMDSELLKYGILDVAMPSPAMMHKLADMDDRVISLVVDSLPLWFAKGAVEPSSVDDFFKRSIVTTSRGHTVRLKVQRDACVLSPGSYDLVVKCKGLRLVKHVFIIEWELVSAEPIEPCMIVDEQEGDEDPIDDVSEDVSPTWEQKKIMELTEGIDAVRVRLEYERESIANALAELVEVEADLERDWPSENPQKHIVSIATRLARFCDAPHTTVSRS